MSIKKIRVFLSKKVKKSIDIFRGGKINIIIKKRNKNCHNDKATL